MFEGYLEKFLIKYFGEFLEGIDKKHLKIAVWKGEITISHVKISPKLLEQLQIPVKLRMGIINNMTITVKKFSIEKK